MSAHTVDPKSKAVFCRGVVVVLWLAAGAGCTTLPANDHLAADPFEGANRKVFALNESIDRHVLQPAATAYTYVLPTPVRTGVSNFFSNLGDVWNLANNLLQGRTQATAETFMRLNVNTLFGLGGVLDVASDLGIAHRPQDFGLTLGRWGVPAGPYVVLPLLGASTIRDAAALPADHEGDLLSAVHDVAVRNSAVALRVVDERSDVGGGKRLLDDAALDPYSFRRDVYLSHRLSMISPDAIDDSGKVPVTH